MHKELRKIRSAAIFLGTFFIPAAHAANFSLTSGLDYSSGKYGGTQSTEILYVPLTGKYEMDRWTFKLTVPYIRITGPGGVTRDIGGFKTSGTTRTTASGLGDVVAAATYNVYDSGGANAWLIDLTGKVKFGTADETKGLGTGKNDYAAQADIYKIFDQFTAFGTLGYRLLGSPAGIHLDNVAYGSLGGSYKFSQQTSGGLILDLRQKAFASGAPQRELTAFVTHKLNQTWKAQSYIVKGFADGSPDWGAGAMLTRAF
ncbi:MAG: hypothetical protein ACYCZQ_04275 [Burkholderiales bacterium]